MNVGDRTMTQEGFHIIELHMIAGNKAKIPLFSETHYVALRSLEITLV